MTYIKRDKLFWIISIFSLWTFPALAIYLLTSKNGEETFWTKVKTKTKFFFKKGSVINSFKATKMFWIPFLVCSSIFTIATIKQQNFNKPYFEKLLSEGELITRFKEDSKDIEFYFLFKDGKVQDFMSNIKKYDLLKTNTGETVYDSRFLNLTSYNNNGMFNFKFNTPLNENIDGLFENELEITLNSNEKKRDLLGFWTFIPNLLYPNLPNANDKGEYNGQVKLTEIVQKKGNSSKDKNSKTYKTTIFMTDVFNVHNQTTNNLEENTVEQTQKPQQDDDPSKHVFCNCMIPGAGGLTQKMSVYDCNTKWRGVCTGRAEKDPNYDFPDCCCQINLPNGQVKVKKMDIINCENLGGSCLPLSYCE